MSAVEDELGMRLARVLRELDEPDWGDVLTRSSLLAATVPRARPRRVAPRILVLVVLGVLLTGGSLALAVSQHVLLASTPPAVLPPAAQSLIDLDLRPLSGATDTSSDRVIPGFSRKVLSVQTSRGTTASLWIAQTVGGRSCFAAIGKPFGSSGCPVRPLRVDPFPVLTWLSRRAARGRIGHEMTLVGQLASPSATRVRLVYADGRSGTYPVVDRWFMLEVPDVHTLRRAEPLRLEALSAAGRVLATHPDPFGLHVVRPALTRPLPATIHQISAALLPDHGGRVAIWRGRDAQGRPCFRWTRNGGGKRYPDWTCSPTVGVSAIPAYGRGSTSIPVQWFLATQRGGHLAPGVGWAYAVGWVGPSAHGLTVRYENGRVHEVKLAGRYFLLVVDPASWAPGRRPSELEVHGTGRTVIYRRSLTPGAHCVYPGRDPVCRNLVTMDGTG